MIPAASGWLMLVIGTAGGAAITWAMLRPGRAVPPETPGVPPEVTPAPSEAPGPYLGALRQVVETCHEAGYWSCARASRKYRTWTDREVDLAFVESLGEAVTYLVAAWALIDAGLDCEWLAEYQTDAEDELHDLFTEIWWRAHRNEALAHPTHRVTIQEGGEQK